ncbi:MAG: type II toxin-antitoxin system RelB/DinJ family antitoxin [Candidatus Riflebacteria bacterium]|jgi:DNA-damage-inducible protein J|nr:type II toxin-antitoxin system RelB/DinJ family antitoxin [Candidatus Riflebacteria bacterium]
MALKSSNVAARVEPEIKEKAEKILSTLGISVSNGINMFYRQVILWNGLPFRPSIPVTEPKPLSEITKEEFDAKMARGIAQAESGEGIPAKDFFENLRREVLKSHV